MLMLKNWVFIGLMAILLGLMILGLATKKQSFGGANIGTPVTMASTTGETATTAVAPIAATSTTCAARIISNTTQGLMLTFNDKDTPSATVGFWQPASTTVAYDCGVYGNGKIKAFSGGGASSNVTVGVVY